MTTLSELRSGIATNIASVAGLRTSAYIPDDPKPPIAVVVPTGIEFDSSMGRGLDTYEFIVTVIVGKVNERTAQSSMDAYCNPSGSSSVKRAIESDRTLAGAASDVRVQSMRNYQAINVGEVQYLAADFTVQVIAVP